MQPCSILKGVGPHTLRCLAKLNIHSIQDLLWHFPSRYQDRSHITPIADLRIGDWALVSGEITQVNMKSRPRRMLLLQLTDESSVLSLQFFHVTASQRAALTVGTQLCCYGEVRSYRKQVLMVHPDYELLADSKEITIADHLTPIYPTTAGLSQKRLRQLIKQALDYFSRRGGFTDPLPLTVREQFNLMELNTAIHLNHQPPVDTPLPALQQLPMRQRFIIEELLAHHLSLRCIRQQLKNLRAFPLRADQTLQEQLLAQLPFQLTQAQKRVLQDIKKDLCGEQPMLRLIQGDVGCGKTIIAALAALQAVGSAYQVAYMAPTELLVEQHVAQFKQWCGPLGLEVIGLTASLPVKSRTHVLQQIAQGDANIVIGTQALFQEAVQFSKLALVIIDEQHRFGVEQRLALWNKGEGDDYRFPHQLIMTATPIPRTLHMTSCADLDISTIDELPAGRKAVNTMLVSNQRRTELMQRIARICRQGQQVYWVCPLIAESDVLQCQAAEQAWQTLVEQLPEFTVGLIHGRMNTVEKQTTMSHFIAGRLPILVATTVIEVGVDVANASLMVIENAERLGLAQLHQLRGRVGRGSEQSYCVLLYQAPLSERAKQRLSVMRDTQDGFVIAKHDLVLRGPGEVLGIQQSGLSQWRFIDLERDQVYFTEVRAIADLLLSKYSQAVADILERWLPKAEQYQYV